MPDQEQSTPVSAAGPQQDQCRHHWMMQPTDLRRTEGFASKVVGLTNF